MLLRNISATATATATATYPPLAQPTPGQLPEGRLPAAPPVGGEEHGVVRKLRPAAVAAEVKGNHARRVLRFLMIVVVGGTKKQSEATDRANGKKISTAESPIGPISGVLVTVTVSGQW